MAARVTRKGIAPGRLKKEKLEQIGNLVNRELAWAEAEAAKATPVGVSGRLRQGWTLIPWDGQRAILGQSAVYYPWVEFGRRPGSGISQEGQFAVARWAKLKLGLDHKESQGFAYGLSERYRRFGRKAQPILKISPSGEPLPGGILDNLFSRIDRGIKTL